MLPQSAESDGSDKLDKKDTKPLELVLDFEVDESNVLKASARLKDFPDITVSRTLSRGGADEKILSSLEDSIIEINRDKPVYFVVKEFSSRAVEVATEANQIIDSQTQTVKPEVLAKVTRRLKVAKDLLERRETCRGNISYVEHFLGSFSKILGKSEIAPIEKKLKELKTYDQSGTVDEILAAKKKLFSLIDKYPVLLNMQMLEQAYDISYHTNPAKAEKLGMQISEIHAAIVDGKTDKITEILEAAAPEAHEIIHGAYHKSASIHKGVVL